MIAQRNRFSKPSAMRVLVVDEWNPADRATQGDRLVAGLRRHPTFRVTRSQPTDRLASQASASDVVLINLHVAMSRVHVSELGVNLAMGLIRHCPYTPVVLYGADPSTAHDVADAAGLSDRLVATDDLVRRLPSALEGEVELARGEKRLAALWRALAGDCDHFALPHRFALGAFIDRIEGAVIRAVLAEQSTKADAADALGLARSTLEQRRHALAIRDEPGGLCVAEPLAPGPRRVVVLPAASADTPRNGSAQDQSLEHALGARGYELSIVQHPHRLVDVAVRRGTAFAVLHAGDGVGVVAAWALRRLLPHVPLLIRCPGLARGSAGDGLPALRVASRLGVDSTIVRDDSDELARVRALREAANEERVVTRRSTAPPPEPSMEAARDPRPAVTPFGASAFLHLLRVDLAEAAVLQHGSIRGAAPALGMSFSALQRLLRRRSTPPA